MRLDRPQRKADSLQPTANSQKIMRSPTNQPTRHSERSEDLCAIARLSRDESLLGLANGNGQLFMRAASKKLSRHSEPREQSLLRGGGNSFAVDHPRNAEAIGAHPEARRPKRFLDGHLHLTVLRQRIEKAIGLRRVFHAQ